MCFLVLLGTVVTFLVSITDIAAWNSIQFCDDDYSITETVGQIAQLQRKFSMNLYKVRQKILPLMISDQFQKWKSYFYNI